MVTSDSSKANEFLEAYHCPISHCQTFLCQPAGRNVKSAILHVISLAHYAIVATRGWAANSINARATTGRRRDYCGYTVPLPVLAVPAYFVRAAPLWRSWAPASRGQRVGGGFS